MEHESDKQIRKIEISDDLTSVRVEFARVSAQEPPEGMEESIVLVDEYKVSSDRKPHQDLINAMKVLRKSALDVCEMKVVDKNIGDFNVTSIKISGDMLLKQSRVELTVSKLVPRTGKYVKWKTPQVTMYGNSEYDKADELTALIEKAVNEALAYLGGKYEHDNQLPLFENIELVLK